jgi:hypothetical protein
MGFPEDLWSGGFDKDWGAAGLGADLTLGMGGMGVNAGILGFGKENWGNWLSGLGRLVDPGGIFEGAQQAKWSPEAYQPDVKAVRLPPSCRCSRVSAVFAPANSRWLAALQVQALAWP